MITPSDLLGKVVFSIFITLDSSAPQVLASRGGVIPSDQVSTGVSLSTFLPSF